MQRKALGKGIGALIPTREDSSSVKIIDIPIEQLKPNNYQPRKVFDSDAITNLAESIKEKGIIQPVIARKSKNGYELIAGERRWRAAQKAGFSVIPAIIREVSNEESLQIALIENIQREDLNPIEQGKAYNNLIQKFGLTQEKIAKMVGKDRTSITNTTRLLKLPLTLQDDIEDGTLTMGHARAILSLESPKDQISLRDKIVKGGLSVRQAESMARAMKTEKPLKQKKPNDIFIAQYEDKLQKHIGAKIKITGNGEKGKIEIRFSSEMEFERILETIIGG